MCVAGTHCNCQDRRKPPEEFKASGENLEHKVKTLRRGSGHRYYLRSAFDQVKMICPILHHAFSLGQVFGAVIRAPDLIALAVGELALDYVQLEVASFIKNG